MNTAWKTEKLINTLLDIGLYFTRCRENAAYGSEAEKMFDGYADAVDEAAKRAAETWISVSDRLPKNHETVLAVKQLKSGQRDICLAYCIPEYERTDPVTKEVTREPYWVCGGNNNILYWRPLPAMPEKEDA